MWRLRNIFATGLILYSLVNLFIHNYMIGDESINWRSFDDEVREIRERSLRKKGQGRVRGLEEEESKHIPQELAIQLQNHLQPEGSKPAFMDDHSIHSTTKPLRAINKEIISTAKVMNLKFVNVRKDNETNHPHAGALDENDKPGYIHDEKALYRNPPPFNFTPEEVECDKKDGTMKMLTEKVFVDLSAHQTAESLAASGVKPRAKIFCLVYTIEKFHDRIPVIRETWANKCDGFMVGSTKTDKALGTVNIPHEGEEEYNNIWQKVQSMWSYVYDNYYEEYDWFHIGGDDLYLLVENLRLYLESDEIQLASNGGELFPSGKKAFQIPLYLGCRFKYHGNAEKKFNTGGSGYTMNKAALKALVVDAFPNCAPHKKTSEEDVMVAQCLEKTNNVFPFDTKDDEGGERYMHFDPEYHLNYRRPKKPTRNDWYAEYSVDIKYGLDHCAAKSVAFHYIKGNMMKRLHAILYGKCG